jgi:hypothetical protein
MARAEFLALAALLHIQLFQLRELDDVHSESYPHTEVEHHAVHVQGTPTQSWKPSILVFLQYSSEIQY